MKKLSHFFKLIFLNTIKKKFVHFSEPFSDLTKSQESTKHSLRNIEQENINYGSIYKL